MLYPSVAAQKMKSLMVPSLAKVQEHKHLRVRLEELEAERSSSLFASVKEKI